MGHHPEKERTMDGLGNHERTFRWHPSQQRFFVTLLFLENLVRKLEGMSKPEAELEKRSGWSAQCRCNFSELKPEHSGNRTELWSGCSGSSWNLDLPTAWVAPSIPPTLSLRPVERTERPKEVKVSDSQERYGRRSKWPEIKSLCYSLWLIVSWYGGCHARPLRTRRSSVRSLRSSRASVASERDTRADHTAPLVHLTRASHESNHPEHKKEPVFALESLRWWGKMK